jgi:hypothetical protein
MHRIIPWSTAMTGIVRRIQDRMLMMLVLIFLRIMVEMVGMVVEIRIVRR